MEQMEMDKLPAFITFTSLFVLQVLAAPALALDPAILDTARTAANEALKTDPAYQQAVTKGDREAQQKIAEATTRAMIIRHVQDTFSPLQMKVDKKIDEVLETALAKTSDKMVTSAQKRRIQDLFKEELYRYMAENEATTVEAPYDSAKGSKLRAEALLTNSYKGSKGFKNEILEILQNINARMGGVLGDFEVLQSTNIIAAEFNKLRSY